ncbi:MAG: dihydroorotase [Muribaculaceae bacterium]|nr:dihydroorotase [Muribaculaceae bacterium]
MARTIIHNALIVNEGKPYKGYLIADGDFIAEVGKGTLPDSAVMAGDELMDACGAYLMPGVIDTHVHFRDPGLTHKGDIATESAAAVAGGVTSYIDMPNTVPPTVDMDAWQSKMDRAAAVSAANYAFYLGATNDNVDMLVGADYTRVPGVKLFLGSSTGNMLVDSGDALTRIFSEVPAVIAVHAEDENRIRANRQSALEVFGNDPVPVDMHPVIRDGMACYQSTKRAVELALRYGTRLHVLHVSTAAELRLFSPDVKKTGRITAETCIQYLWWSDKDYETSGTRIKCNPAIKADSDRRALCRAVRDGVVDTIGSDHAPHLLSEKNGDAITAPSGCPNMQFALPMMMDLSSGKAFRPEVVVERMAHAPARLFGIDRRGFLRPGYYADMTLVSSCEPYMVADTDSVSRCGWLPVAGTMLSHRVEATWVNGRLAYDRSGVKHSVAGMPLRFTGQ